MRLESEALWIIKYSFWLKGSNYKEMLKNFEGRSFFISYGQSVHAEVGQKELQKDTMRVM